MNWVSIHEKKPELNESIVLAINFERSKGIKFWKKKLIAFGWLDRIVETKKGLEYTYYDHTNDCHWKSSVTHWMTLPKPTEVSRT